MQRHGQFFVYMVQCQDGTYYTGYTNNLQDRIRLHNSGNGAKYLRGKGPVTLVYAKEYRYYKVALRAERWLKKRARAEKAALIRGYEEHAIRVGPKISLPLVAKSVPGPIHKFGGQR